MNVNKIKHGVNNSMTIIIIRDPKDGILRPQIWRTKTI